MPPPKKINKTQTHNPQSTRQVPGPPALTQEEVLAPFLGEGASLGPASSVPAFTTSGRFRLRSLEPGRFDPTPAYGSTPPRAWVALFEKSG